MFNSISGTISFKGSHSIYICTGGIEWELFATAQSLKDFPPAGQETRAFVFLYHREDQMRLYGFSCREERSLFLDLLKVGGLGPKLAIKILSAITYSAFITALEKEDLNTLSSLPGLGKKTAQKVLLVLQGKLKKPDEPDRAADLNEDIINALIGMGFDKKLSREAVITAGKELQSDELSGEELDKELFTRALGIAGRKKA
ncbi:MAG: Holliday junction branch migration protein RuvA [Spirochaetia bacterium]